MQFLNRKEDGVSAKNKIFSSYKRGALLRNIEFHLSFDDVINLSQQNCHYCGIEPSNSTKAINKNGATQILWNGIDRINNEIGYTLENCVTACKQCNFAKFKFSYKEFKDYLKRIGNFYGTS